MKATTSLFLIISLLFIAVFGVAALDHSMNHERSNCAASIMTNALCPTNLKSTVTHHFSVIQSFFNVPVSTFVFSVILLIGVLMIGFAYLFKFLLSRSRFIAYRSRDYGLAFASSKHGLISWLSLLEHSPSI